MEANVTTIQIFLVSGTFVWLYLGLTVLYFLGWSLALLRKRIQLGSALRRAIDALRRSTNREGFAERFAEIDSEVRANRVLGDAWAEFTECLILPEGESKVVRNTRDPSSYFSADQIINDHLNVRFYSSIPGHLTGLGILGTFLGLAAGIGLAQSGLSGNTQQIQASLQSLLRGASLAFLTSIAGLTTSMLFLFFERWQVAALDRRRAAWVRLLDERLLRVTQEGIAAKQLQELTEQTRELKTFNTDLAVSIANALDERLASTLAPQIAELKEALDGIKTQQGAANDQLISSVVERFEQSMTGAAGREMDALGQTLQELNKAVTASAEGLERQQERASASLREMAEMIQAALGDSSSRMQEELGETIARLTRATERSAEAMRDASQAAGASANQAMQQAVEQMSARLSASVGSLSERLEDSSGQVASRLTAAGEAAAERLDSTAGEIAARVASLQESFERSAAILGQMQEAAGKVSGAAQALGEAGAMLGEVMPSMKETSSGIRMASMEIRGAAETVADLTETIAESSAQLRDSQERVGATWSAYIEKFDRTDEQLADIFRQIEEGLDRYTTRIRTFTQEVDKSLASAVSTLSAVVDELGQVLEDYEGRRGS